MMGGLAEALAAESAERDNLGGMRRRINRATDEKASALAKRKAAVEKLAAGGSESEAAKIDQAIRSAESTIAVLSEAMILAEGRVRDAEAATETILRSELSRRASLAQADYDKAVEAVSAAATARF